MHNSCEVENSDTVIDEDIVLNSANKTGKGGYYEIMLDDNRGIRLNMDMAFKGFINQRR